MLKGLFCLVAAALRVAPPHDRPALADAQSLFYNAHYEAAAVARRLARDFPDNREVAAFLETHGTSARRRHP